MILIIGEMKCTELDLRNCAKKNFGLTYEDIEIFSDYGKIKSFNFQALKNSHKYSDVIFGQVPHSAGKSGSQYSGVIQKMQNEPGYPNIIKASRTMKLTISSFKKAILSSNWYKSQQNDLTKATNSDII